LVSLHYRLQLVLVPQLLENPAQHLKVIIGLVHQRSREALLGAVHMVDEQVQNLDGSSE